jgi:hypothetical protein
MIVHAKDFVSFNTLLFERETERSSERCVVLVHLTRQLRHVDPKFDLDQSSTGEMREATSLIGNLQGILASAQRHTHLHTWRQGGCSGIPWDDLATQNLLYDHDLRYVLFQHMHLL